MSEYKGSLNNTTLVDIEYLNKLKAKAKAFDNYLLSVEKDAKNEFGDNQALIKHAVELNKKIFMEDE